MAVKPKHKILTVLFALMCFTAVLYSFTSATDRSERLAIKLKWNKAYTTEDWHKMRTGILWSLSFLGAALPEGSLDKAIVFDKDTFHFTLQLDKVGFTKNAEDALQVIVDSLKSSEEYLQKGHVDVGRFFVLTLHCSHHYYAITGAEKTLDEFKKNHPFAIPQKFLLIQSGVAKHNRRIFFHKPQQALQLAFIAEEGHGKVTDSGFKPEGYEVSAFMPSGQFRYAVYDENGKLDDASPTGLGAAGKPGKCMWCHEADVQKLYYVTPEVEGEMTSCDFEDCVAEAQQLVDKYRATLKTDVQYRNRQDHTYAELLYITFMEPNILRLTNEWEVKEDALANSLKNANTHIYEEFPFLGNLYHRAFVDSLARYKPVKVPLSVREPNNYEPNFFAR